MVQISVLLGTFLALLAVQTHGAPKIAPTLLNNVKGSANIFITMQDATDPIIASVSARMGAARNSNVGTELYDSLRQHAQRTQEPILTLIASSKSILSATQIHSYWISNQIFVRDADLSILDLLANRADVARVDEEQVIQLDPIDLQPVEDQSVKAVDWNLDIIGAPQIWADGVNGTGVVRKAGIRNTILQS